MKSLPTIGVNDLASKNPAVASQAHGWDPSTVTYGSKKIVEWIGDCGHTWLASPNSRTNAAGPRGCPFCASRGAKLLPGFNDLATTDPELSKEAIGWDPTQIKRGSMKKLPWKSGVCGHTFLNSPNARSSKGIGCPYCPKRKLLRGFNDVATVYPFLATQAEGWNPQDTIASVSSPAGKKLGWVCSVGHKWQEPLVNRVRSLGICPECHERTKGFSIKDSGYLYMICHPDWGLTQIGISNSRDNRIKKHKESG